MLKVKSFEQSQTGIWVMSKHEIMDLLDQPFANQGCPPAEYTFINHEDMVMLRSIQKGKLPIDVFVCCPSPDIQVEFNWHGRTAQIQAHLLHPSMIGKIADSGLNSTIGYFDISVYNDESSSGFVAPIILVHKNDKLDVITPCIGFIDDRIGKLYDGNPFPTEPVVVDDKKLMMRLQSFNLVKRVAILFWCRVQHALSHPDIIASVHRNDREVDVTYPKNLRSNIRIREKAVGIRRVYLDEAIRLTAEKMKYERHTPSWYVEGHFRKLPNGDITWVNGYWKGPERETMHPTRNIDIVNGGA